MCLPHCEEQVWDSKLVGELKKRSETDEAESGKALPIPSGREDRKGGCGPFFH